MRFWIGAGFGILAVSAVAQQYHVIDLGNFNGVGNSFAAGLSNANGFATGIADLNANVDQAFFYSSQTGMVRIGNFAAAPNDQSHGAGVNSSGMVAGYGVSTTGGTYHAFNWTQAGGLNDLGLLPGGTGSIAYGINDSGEIVGTADTPSVANGVAFTWTQAGGLVNIGGFSGLNDQGAATCVNASGQVGGEAVVVANSYAHGFVWTPGQGFVEIGDFDGGHQDSTVHAINGAGAAVGEATIGTSGGGRGTVPFFWSASTGEINMGSLFPSNPIDVARGINIHNQVVGYSNVQGVGLEGWIWTQGNSLTRIDTLLDASSAANWTIQDAESINDAGVIVATAFHPGANGTSRNAAVLLVPVPEPSSMLALAGLAGWVATRRKARSRRQ